MAQQQKTPADSPIAIAAGFCVLLFVALLATHIPAAGVLDTLAVLAVLAGVVAYHATQHTTLPVPIGAGVVFAGLAALLLVQIAFFRFATWKLALAPFASVAAIAVALFVLPRVVSWRAFVRTSALFVALGMTLLGGGVPHTGPGWFAIASLLAVVGCVGTAALFDREYNPFDLALCLCSGWFVCITLQRAAIVVLAVALILYALATRCSYRLAGVAVAVGALSLLAFVTVIIAAPSSWVGGLPLTQRQWLWRGTWRAIAHSPLAFFFGVGFVNAKQYLTSFTPHWMASAHGPHNGYLLVWLRAGVVAAALHAALVWGTIAIGLWRHARPAVLAATVALAVDMTVANFTLMTLGLRGVLLAALLGYLLQEVAEWHYTVEFGGVKHRLGRLGGYPVRAVVGD